MSAGARRAGASTARGESGARQSVAIETRTHACTPGASRGTPAPEGALVLGAGPVGLVLGRGADAGAVVVDAVPVRVVDGVEEAPRVGRSTPPTHAAASVSERAIATSRILMTHRCPDRPAGQGRSDPSGARR